MKQFFVRHSIPLATFLYSFVFISIHTIIFSNMKKIITVMLFMEFYPIESLKGISM